MQSIDTARDRAKWRALSNKKKEQTITKLRESTSREKSVPVHNNQKNGQMSFLYNMRQIVQI